MLPEKLLLSISLEKMEKSLDRPHHWVQAVMSRFVLVLQMYQLHAWAKNLARYGARELIDPKVTAETGCIHEKQNLKMSNKIIYENVLTSALYLSDYPAQDLSRHIQEVLRWAYCQPDQTSIALKDHQVMVVWDRWIGWSSKICRQSAMTYLIARDRHITSSMTWWNLTWTLDWSKRCNLLGFKVVCMNVISDGVNYAWLKRRL